MADQNVNTNVENLAALDLSDDGMLDFIAEAPDGTILHTRRAVEQDPIRIVIGGYHAKTGELGVFHWTSKATKSYVKRVILNTLRKARKFGVPLDAESIFVSHVIQSDDVPEDAQTFSRATKSFVSRAIPRLTVAQRIELVTELLKDEELSEARRAKLLERLERLQTKTQRTPRPEEVLAPEDKEKLDGLMAEVKDVVATRSNLGFRVKRFAQAVAKEKGLPANSVSRTEHGAWVVTSTEQAGTEEK